MKINKNPYPDSPKITNLKQCIIVNCSELHIITILFKLSEPPARLWVHNEVEVEVPDEENTITEVDLGWIIRVRDNPEEIGRLTINDYKVGILISYWSITDDGWNVVNEFMNLLFSQLKQDGYPVIPRNEKSIEIQVKELRRKFKKSTSFLEQSEGDSLFSKNRKDICSELLPASKTTKERWKRIYGVVVKTRQDYLEEYKDHSSKRSKGKIPDYQDAIAAELMITVGERTLRKIIKAGDLGFLK
jgi:hypothetical protein